MKLKGILFWKHFIVFTHATFIEIIICILLQLQIVDNSWTESAWVFISFVLWVSLIGQAVYILLSLFVFVWPKYSQLATSENLKRKYGFLFVGLDLNDKPLAMFFQVSYFTRRIVLAVVAIYLNHAPIF